MTDLLAFLVGFLIGCVLGYVLAMLRSTQKKKVKVDVDVKGILPEPASDTPAILHDMRIRALNMAQRVYLGARRVTGSLVRCEGHIDDATTSTRRCEAPHKDTLESLRSASSNSHEARASMANIEVGTGLIPGMLDVTAERRRLL